MNIKIYNDSTALGRNAGAEAALLIKRAIKEKNCANIILATGTSQFETINYLISDTQIEWNKVTMFHLDEYINLPITHLASFRKYLLDRFISKVSPLAATYLIDGENDARKECNRLSTLIINNPIDVALVGIGENGHLAFNDPPADFSTEDPYIIVTLDEACRAQQTGEGWFKNLQEVPTQAISMSVKQILKSSHIICSVPDLRKATAVKNSVEQPISNLFPATALQAHSNCQLYLDQASASLLSESFRI